MELPRDRAMLAMLVVLTPGMQPSQWLCPCRVSSTEFPARGLSPTSVSQERMRELESSAEIFRVTPEHNAICLKGVCFAGLEYHIVFTNYTNYI